MSWPTMQQSSQKLRKSQQFDKRYLHSHTHIHGAVKKASLGKVTSTVKHAELHCRASLPVRHWCGNGHLRVIMGWLAPRVWDPGADSLGWIKRERGERRYVLSTEGWVTLSTPLTLSVQFPFLSPSLFLLSWLISSTILVFISCFLFWSFWLSLFLSSLWFLFLSPATLSDDWTLSHSQISECEVKQLASRVCLCHLIKPQSMRQILGANLKSN